MKFLKSLMMGTGGVVLAGLVLALLAPKAVHAVVATAVQVVNTSANPAITEDASRQASQIVTIECVMELTSAFGQCFQKMPNGNSGSPGPNGGYVVPANQYFVLKSMDSYISSGTTSVTTIDIVAANNGKNRIEYTVPPLNGQISFSSGIVAGPTLEVVPEATVFVSGVLTLHGYLTSN